MPTQKQLHDHLGQINFQKKQQSPLKVRNKLVTGWLVPNNDKLKKEKKICIGTKNSEGGENLITETVCIYFVHQLQDYSASKPHKKLQQNMEAEHRNRALKFLLATINIS